MVSLMIKITVRKSGKVMSKNLQNQSRSKSKRRRRKRKKSMKHKKNMIYGMLVMDVIKPLMLENLDLIAILVTTLLSVKSVIERIRHIFISSQDKKYHSNKSHLKTVKNLLKKLTCFAIIVKIAC